STSGGVTIDPSTKELRFKGVQVIWDPDFDRLDDVLGAITYPWKKRCYLLNSKAGAILRPFKGLDDQPHAGSRLRSVHALLRPDQRLRDHHEEAQFHGRAVDQLTVNHYHAGCLGSRRRRRKP